MEESTPFRRAVEAHSLDGMMAIFAEDAVLHSPITFPRSALEKLLAQVGSRLAAAKAGAA